jgi:hypothetical protein
LQKDLRRWGYAVMSNCTKKRVPLGMPQSGSELKFGPELLRTGPKSGSKFRNFQNRTFFEVWEGKIARTLALYGNISGSEPRTGPEPKFRFRNLPKPDQKFGSGFAKKVNEPD